MNDVDNATSAGGPTPETKPQFEQFRYLTQLLRQLQIQRAVEIASAEREGTRKKVPLPHSQLDGDFVIEAVQAGYDFDQTQEGLFLVKDEQFAALIVHPTAKYSREMQEVARLLQLEIDYDSPSAEIYELDAASEGRIQRTSALLPLYANHPQSRMRRLPPPACVQESAKLGRTIVVSTRSLLEVMYYLSQGISVPEQHQAEGLVTLTLDEYGAPFDWSELTGDLLRVMSCEHRPKGTAVAVPYKGYWFYIDDRDLNSQSTFNFLVELFGIEVRAGGGGGFLYTLNVGG